MKAPPKVTSPAFSPSQKISEVSERDTVPTRDAGEKGRERDRVRATHQALAVLPQLIGEAGAEKDEREARPMQTG